MRAWDWEIRERRMRAELAFKLAFWLLGILAALIYLIYRYV
jgi:hypothetical protein